MKSSKLIILAVAFVIFCAIAVFLRTVVRSFFYSPDKEIQVSSLEGVIPSLSGNGSTTTPSQDISTGPAFPAEHPSRLVVPSLNIDAAVQNVGIAPEGRMANPNNFTDVGWYKYGTLPGQTGSAVIAGHLDNGLSLAGAFKHLSDIKTGDDIFIQTKEGSRLHFVVTEVVSYFYAEVPSDKVFNRNDAARLNLITCDGNWLAKQKTYDQRSVVYSQLTD